MDVGSVVIVVFGVLALLAALGILWRVSRGQQQAAPTPTPPAPTNGDNDGNARATLQKVYAQRMERAADNLGLAQLHVDSVRVELQAEAKEAEAQRLEERRQAGQGDVNIDPNAV